MAAGTRLCGAPKPSLNTTSKPTTLTPQARRTFQESFDSFEQTVRRYSRTDDCEFSNITLRDVRDAAKQVERQLAARQCMRNMKRLEPFLNGLEAYSKVIEVLCNGTPFLSWIWAPIKLMMQLATDHISAFEKLLAAYSQIAAMLPRFDRLGTALQDKPDFQQALAVVYSDILTFHEHAYKLFRRNGWICFFKSSWGQFGSRFNCILDSLAKHATLIDQEANAYLVSETMLWRREALQVVAKTEKDRSTAQLTAALSWLGLETVPHCGQAYQDNLLDKLIKDCCDGTTDWILKHQRMRQWLQNGRGGPILWLKGKPGSGKSTLCAKLVHFLRAPRQSTVLFCFYSYIVSSTYPDPVVFILATLVSQILRQRTDLATYVYEDFVAESRPPSIRNLQEALSNLLPQLVMPRILIDGIDECIRYDMHGKPSDLTPVKDVLASILQLESPTQACAPTKILVVSRDILEVVGKLSKRPTVALDQESDALTADITRFATKRLETIRERFGSLHGVDDILQEVKKNVVSRSQGMFLWVRLVLLQLEDDADNLDDLENAVANMPHSLHDFYARIVHRIMLYSPQSRERTINILKLMLCSRRPLRVAELQDAVVFASGAVSLSERSKLPTSIVDRCRPLVQTDDNEQISFVHFTVQEYLTKSGFISLRDAERCTTVTCVNYLTFSLDLSNLNISARRKAVGVGKCLYTLQPYIHEHWLDHLLAFAAEATQARDRQLEACLEVLLSIYHHQYARYLDPANKVQPDILAARNLEPRLRFLEHYGDHYKFLCVYVNYRHTKQVHFEMPDDNSEPLDPTPLTVVQLEYAKQVEFLLSADAVPGLTPEELTMFKSTNCPYAFVCRFPGCSGMLAGFPTHDLRAQHEMTHKPTLFCTHSGCKYGLPFASRQSLGRHVRNFHSSVPRSMPKSIRRRRATQHWSPTDFQRVPTIPTPSVSHQTRNKDFSQSYSNLPTTRYQYNGRIPDLYIDTVPAEPWLPENPGSRPTFSDIVGNSSHQNLNKGASHPYSNLPPTRYQYNGRIPDLHIDTVPAESWQPSRYPPTNGVNNSGKRGRDDEDQDLYRPENVQGDDMGGLKRRKTMEGSDDEVELLDTNASPPLVATIEGEEESSTIKCICGYSDDDGNTVLCEKCDTWQHIVCYYESAQHVPDVHECANCLPRPMDLRSASEKQRLRREVHSISERKGLFKASTKDPKTRTKDTHVPPSQQQAYSPTHPYTSPMQYEQREGQPQNNGERSSDPQSRPERQYRSYHAPGTQFRSYQGPSSYEHYRRVDGQMKKYPSGNEYFSNPHAETQQLHDSSNRTRTQSATARTTTDDELGHYMKIMAHLSSEEHDNAVGNDKAAENRLIPNDSITRPPPKFPDARPKFLEVPGLPTSRRNMGSPSLWGTQYIA